MENPHPALGRILVLTAIALTVLATRAAAAPFAYVTVNRGVVAVDLATNTFAGTFRAQPPAPGGSAVPVALAFAPNAAKAYASVINSSFCDPNGFCGIATVHSFNFEHGTFGAGTRLRLSQDRPGFLAASPDGRLFYVAEAGDCYSLRAIYALETETNTIVGDAILLPRGARCNGGRHSVTPDGKFLLVGTGDGVYVADTTTRRVLGAPIPVPGEVEISADGKLLYVLGRGKLAVVDFASRGVLAEIPVAGSVTMALSPDGRFIYASGGTSTSAPPPFVTVIDTSLRRVVGTVAFPPHTAPVIRNAMAPDGKRVYLLTYRDNGPSRNPGLSLFVVDTATRTILRELVLGDYEGGFPIVHDLVIPRAQFPVSVVLDRFTRADGALGSDWSGSTATTNFRIAANQVDVGSGGRIFWQRQSFGVNQEAFIRMVKMDLATSQGVILKAQSSGPATTPSTAGGAIEVSFDPKLGVRLRTWRPGITPQSTLYPAQQQLLNEGDLFGARVSASGVVQVYRNGALMASFTLNTADQAFFNHNGGRIGVRFVGNAQDGLFDDFGGGTVP